MHMPSFTELLVVLAIVVLVFGTRKLKTLGTDLGAGIRSFRNAMRDGGSDEPPAAEVPRKPDGDGEPPR